MPHGERARRWSARLPLRQEVNVAPTANVGMPDDAVQPTQHATRPALAAALLGFFVITLDAVVVNVALPTMGHELHAGISGLQWVVDGYTLAFAAFLLSSGALADRVGARQAFGVGLLIFVLASAACGFAPNLGALVVARLFQGIGAAVMMPSSMSLIRQSYTDPVQRGHAVALWAMGGSVAATSGPVIGGLLSLLNWRWIFFINLPVGLGTLFFLSRAHASTRREAPLDGWGQLMAVVAMGMLTYGAIEIGEKGIAASPVIVSLVVTFVSLAAFVILQKRGFHLHGRLLRIAIRHEPVSATAARLVRRGDWRGFFPNDVYGLRTYAIQLTDDASL